MVLEEDGAGAPDCRTARAEYEETENGHREGAVLSRRRSTMGRSFRSSWKTA